MAWPKEIKRKIKSIKNTWKITKAMELISTVKMKKAQDAVNTKKEFILEILKIFLRIESSLQDLNYFKKYETNKILVVMIWTNRWLCWAYNLNLMKKLNSYLYNNKNEFDFIAVWQKVSSFLTRTWNNVIADFSSDYTDNISLNFTKNISSFMREQYLTWKYSNVIIVYNHFVNTIKQIPVTRKFLSINSKEIKEYLYNILDNYYNLEEELLDKKNSSYYEIEPSKTDIILDLIPMILDMMFYDILLEAKASEHSSRMLAMKSAKDNTKKIANNLSLIYNKLRQSWITREISEITAWVESMKDV